MAVYRLAIPAPIEWPSKPKEVQPCRSKRSRRGRNRRGRSRRDKNRNRGRGRGKVLKSYEV